MKGLERTSEQYSYTVNNIKDKFPVFVDTTTDEPLYLCRWNNNEIVEVHTERSLYETYKDTNLYDGGFQDDFDMSIEEVLNEMQVEDRRVFDNMDIRRIK